MKITKADRRALMRDLREADGNIRRTADNLGLTRHVIEYRVKAAGLEEYAARLRLKGGVSGGRSALFTTREGDAARIRKIESALAKCKTQGKAAAALGIHRRRLQREMERLGIP